MKLSIKLLLLATAVSSLNNIYLNAGDREGEEVSNPQKKVKLNIEEKIVLKKEELPKVEKKEIE